MWTENVEEATEEILKKMTELTVNQMMTDEQTTRDPEMPLMTFKSRNDKKVAFFIETVNLPPPSLNFFLRVFSVLLTARC